MRYHLKVAATNARFLLSTDEMCVIILLSLLTLTVDAFEQQLNCSHFSYD